MPNHTNTSNPNGVCRISSCNSEKDNALNEISISCMMANIGGTTVGAKVHTLLIGVIYYKGIP